MVQQVILKHAYFSSHVRTRIRVREVDLPGIEYLVYSKAQRMRLGPQQTHVQMVREL